MFRNLCSIYKPRNIKHCHSFCHLTDHYGAVVFFLTRVEGWMPSRFFEEKICQKTMPYECVRKCDYFPCERKSHDLDFLPRRCCFGLACWFKLTHNEVKLLNKYQAIKMRSKPHWAQHRPLSPYFILFESPRTLIRRE